MTIKIVQTARSRRNDWRAVAVLGTLLAAAAAKATEPSGCNTPPSDTSLNAVRAISPKYQSDGMPQNFMNQRVIGTGSLASYEVSWDYHQLLTKQQMTQDGTLSKNTKIKLMAWYQLTPQFYAMTHLVPANGPARVTFTATFSINGHPIKDVTLQTLDAVPGGVSASWMGCVDVNSMYLNFPMVKGDGRSGIPPDPEPNEVDAKVRMRIMREVWQPDFSSLGLGTAGIGPLGLLLTPMFLILNPMDVSGLINFKAEATHLEYEAMAPVVLVHGIRTKSNWFQPYAKSRKGAGFYVDKWFTKPFDDARLSYRAIDFDEDLITPGGKNVAKEVQKVAASFGARRVHVVAHSKGGLWSRAFLGDEANMGGKPGSPVKVGIFSLTTIDTPHLGSYNADNRRLINDCAHARTDCSLNVIQSIFLDSAPYKPSVSDLTTWDVATFNKGNNLPNKTQIDGRTNLVHYNVITADANLDDSCEGGTAPCSHAHPPTISFYNSAAPELDESEAYEYPDDDVKKLKRLPNVGQFLYRDMFFLQRAELFSCDISTGYGPVKFRICIRSVDGAPQLNDFQVTEESARGAGLEKFSFVELMTEKGSPFKHNHTMVGQEDVAQRVLKAIRVQQEYK
jgi:hypothetical protein